MFAFLCGWDGGDKHTHTRTHLCIHVGMCGCSCMPVLVYTHAGGDQQIAPSVDSQPSSHFLSWTKSFISLELCQVVHGTWPCIPGTFLFPILPSLTTGMCFPFVTRILAIQACALTRWEGSALPTEPSPKPITIYSSVNIFFSSKEIFQGNLILSWTFQTWKGSMWITEQIGKWDLK